MSGLPISHVGLALFNTPSRCTQWVLVISDNEVFQGHVMCSTTREGLGGWQEFWVQCLSSPTAFNNSAVFAGVIHIGTIPASMQMLQADFHSKGPISSGEESPDYSDRYAVRSLIRLSRRLPFLPTLEETRLANFIQGSAHVIQDSQQVTIYPVVFLRDGEVRLVKRN